MNIKSNFCVAYFEIDVLCIMLVLTFQFVSFSYCSGCVFVVPGLMWFAAFALDFCWCILVNDRFKCIIVQVHVFTQEIVLNAIKF